MSEQKIVKCPFCKIGDIITLYTPRMKITSYARAGSNKKAINFYKDEKYVILTDKCLSCGKTKKEISERLSGESSVKVSEAVRRAKEMGLPTKF